MRTLKRWRENGSRFKLEAGPSKHFVRLFLWRGFDIIGSEMVGNEPAGTLSDRVIASTRELISSATDLLREHDARKSCGDDAIAAAKEHVR